jgi:hypothetical protein
LNVAVLGEGQLEHEHGPLLEAAGTLLSELRGFRERFMQHDVEYHQHRVYADRGRALLRQFEAALMLLRAHLYAPAFDVLRVALEQMVFDRLLFLASRFRQVIENVPDDEWNSWWTAWEKKEPGTERITDMRRKGNVVTVEQLGLHSSDPSAADQVLSVYFFRLRDYDPFVGSPNEQSRLASYFRDEERAREYARRQRNFYHRELRWQQMLDNLVFNGLNVEEETFRLNVHYRFLSAFVHPITDQHDLLYGRQWENTAAYDHYTSELALLYTIVIACTELTGLLAGIARPPAVSIQGADELTATIDEARRRASHLWFVGDPPHIYDRIYEANHRLWDTTPSGPQRAPDQLTDDEVRYYRNPLQRLIKLHQSTNELMGYSYRSPWHRPDAISR